MDVSFRKKLVGKRRHWNGGRDLGEGGVKVVTMHNLQILVSKIMNFFKKRNSRFLLDEFEQQLALTGILPLLFLDHQYLCSLLFLAYL